jgi:putative transposase
VTPSARREAAAVLVREHRLSVQRSCRIARLSRAAYYRPPQAAMERDLPVIEALNATVERHPRIGFWKCVDRIRRGVFPWNHKRLHRVYVALGLNLPRRSRRRLPARLRQPLEAPAVLNGTWALDFMTDALYGGRKFRTLNVIDEGNREALAIEIGTSIPSVRVIRLIEELVLLHGKPTALRVDNGPELTAEAFAEWCRAQEIDIRYIQPGKPDQNAYIERFNRSYRQDVLDAYVFSSLEEVRVATEEWLRDYNTERPHDSLGRVPPLTFLPRPTSIREYSFNLSP